MFPQEKVIHKSYSVLVKARQKYKELRSSELEMANWEEMLDPLGKYYILLKENTGKCYGRMNFLQKLIPPYVEQPDIDFNAEMGTLYEKAPDEMQPSSKSMIGLVSIENSDSFICYLVIQLSDTKEINFKELKLLLAVISKDERVATAMNACQFKRASLAEVGDKVLVKRVFRDSMDDLKCFVIKSIQHSGKGNGHYFYISLKVNYLDATRYLFEISETFWKHMNSLVLI